LGSNHLQQDEVYPEPACQPRLVSVSYHLKYNFTKYSFQFRTIRAFTCPAPVAGKALIFCNCPLLIRFQQNGLNKKECLASISACLKINN